MKLHIEVDSETGVMHSMTTTAANVHDVSEAHRLLHGGESQVRGDAGYRGAGKREENRETGGELAGGDAAGAAAETGPGQRGSIGGAKQGIDTGEEPALDGDRGWSTPS